MTWGAVLRLVPSPVGIVGTLVLLMGYVVTWARARRTGSTARVVELALFVLVGVVPYAVATCSGLGEVRRESLQAGAWQAGLLVAVAPAGIGMGRPVSLLRAVLGARGQARLDGVLRSRPLRFLAFPLVSAVLAAFLVLVVFLTDWYQASVASAAVRELTYLALVGAGLVFLLPLLGEAAEVLPAWCTPAVRAGLAVLDGLTDAVAGIVVMTAGGPLWSPATPRPEALVMSDQQLAGAILLCLSEAVGLPVILASVVAWMRADAAEARAADAADDARRAEPGPPGPADPSVGAVSAAFGPSRETAPGEPWWLSDPRMADRIRRQR